MDLHYLYRPLRNHLRQIDLRESLLVVRSYLDNLRYGSPLPSEFDIPVAFRNSDKFRALGVYEFQLETLCKEIIINADVSGRPRKSFRRWNYFAAGLNKMKTLEEALYEKLVPANRVWTELVRIAHRQFPWQENAPSASMIMRYLKIYSAKGISNIFEQHYGYSVSTHFMIASVIFGHFSRQFALLCPPENRIPKIQQRDLDAFLNTVSIDWKALREMLSEENTIDECYPYRFYSLRKYPLIYCAEYSRAEYLCPISNHLIWRITDGIYYDFIGMGDFGHYYGYAFQNYIGEVLFKAIDQKKMTIVPESSYTIGKNRKDTVDWILYDDKAAIFIETKTKKLVQSAKEEIETDRALNDQLEYQCQHVLQVYKTVVDYENGFYQNLPYSPDMEVYPIIVTLENWHLFGHEQLGFIDNKLEELLKKAGIDIEIRRKYPYSFCSALEIERCIEIVGKVGVSQALHGKATSREHAQWELSPYLSERFPKEWRESGNLFKTEFDRLFESWVGEN